MYNFIYKYQIINKNAAGGGGPFSKRLTKWFTINNQDKPEGVRTVRKRTESVDGRGKTKKTPTKSGSVYTAPLKV